MGSIHRVALGLGAFVIASSFASVLSAQNTEITWPRSLKFSASDKRDVVALAMLMGVHDPESVDAYVNDDCCRIVEVRGRVVENGPERRWPVASMIRNNWREYAGAAPPGGRLRSGRWFAAEVPVRVWAEWRVRDGEWFVDVGRSTDRPSVTYADAELIVQALRRGRIVNNIAGQPPIPTLIGGRNYMLLKYPGTAGASASDYEISVADRLLRVRVVGDSVEAVSLSVVEF